MKWAGKTFGTPFQKYIESTFQHCQRHQLMWESDAQVHRTTVKKYSLFGVHKNYINSASLKCHWTCTGLIGSHPHLSQSPAFPAKHKDLEALRNVNTVAHSQQSPPFTDVHLWSQELKHTKHAHWVACFGMRPVIFAFEHNVCLKCFEMEQGSLQP